MSQTRKAIKSSHVFSMDDLQARTDAYLKAQAVVEGEPADNVDGEGDSSSDGSDSDDSESNGDSDSGSSAAPPPQKKQKPPAKPATQKLIPKQPEPSDDDAPPPTKGRRAAGSSAAPPRKRPQRAAAASPAAPGSTAPSNASAEVGILTGMVAEMGQLLQRFKEGRFNDSRGRDAQKLIKDCMSRIKSIGDLFAKLSKGGAADIPDISVSKSVESMVAILKVFAKGDRATFQDFSSAWAKCRELAQDNDHFTATLVSKNAEVAGVFRQQGRAFSALCPRAFNQSYVGRGWFQTQVDIQASP